MVSRGDGFRTKVRRGELSAARVLAAVITGPASSRKAVELQLGVSKASACRMVDQLLERGLLQEGATFPSRGRGRSATLLHARPDLGFLVGADLEGLAVRVCVLDCARHVIVSRRRAIGAGWSIARILRGWRTLIAEALQAAGADPDRVIGLGVALPGMAASGDDCVRTYLPPGRLVRFGVHEELSEFGLPIVASDNTLCVSEYERRLGVAKDVPSFLSVLVRYGIGAAIFSRGRFVVGEELLCSELGHMRVQLDGPRCVCGQRGCLDAYCSGRTWPEGGVRRGEASERAVVDRARMLGVGLGNLLKLVHSRIVILNGVYNEFEESVRRPLEESIDAELEPLGLASPQLVFGAPQEEKACIGAALRAVDREMANYLVRYELREAARTPARRQALRARTRDQ